MRVKIQLLMFLSLAVSALTAQNTPSLELVKGGTFLAGGGYQFKIENFYMVYLGEDKDFEKMNQGQVAIGEIPAYNSPKLQVSVADFYLSSTEVTNKQYIEFILAKSLSPSERAAFDKKFSGKRKSSFSMRDWDPIFERAAELKILPDTACWVKDFVFAYNEPLAQFYFSHPAFENYPVVGVSWHQAKAYCQWLTESTNDARKAKGLAPLPEYRLPTEMEWEFAAKPRMSEEEIAAARWEKQVYPWGQQDIIQAGGKYLANVKTNPMDYIGDGYEYTAPVQTFPANGNGMYDMAGNVAEWCEDVFILRREGRSEADLNPRLERATLFTDASEEAAPLQRVVKGGSWAEYKYAAQCGSRMGFDEGIGSSRIGFRVAMSKN